MSADIIKEAKEKSNQMMLMIEPFIDQISIVDLKLQNIRLNTYSQDELLNIRKWSVDEINKLLSTENQK